jgi:hypothetical protein
LKFQWIIVKNNFVKNRYSVTERFENMAIARRQHLAEELPCSGTYCLWFIASMHCKATDPTGGREAEISIVSRCRSRLPVPEGVI